MAPRITVWPVFAAALTGLVGCALTAEQPPTPAQYLEGEQLAAIPVPPGERYYLLVFSSQSVPKRAKYTHTWATVVRARHPAGGCGSPEILSVDTISWMPADLGIEPRSFKVEPGVNLTLHKSLQVAVDTDQRISLWGPYECWHGLYHRFLVQKAFMESGQTGYQCIDSIGEARDGSGCDCIHAITDMDPRYDRFRYPLAFYGDAASRRIVREVMHAPVVIAPRTTHDWLIPALSLDDWPIRRRAALTLIREDYEPGDAGLDDVRAVGPVPSLSSFVPDGPTEPDGNTNVPSAPLAGEVPVDPAPTSRGETPSTANPPAAGVSE